jgi:peroxiredoxin
MPAHAFSYGRTTLWRGRPRSSFGTVILVLSRLLLAAVFAIAAVAKLGRRAETESTLGAFGVGLGSRRPLAIALPLVELTIAAALLPAASAPYAGVAAFGLLAVFTVAVARVLRRGEQVDCNCFGSLGASRISGWTLARNLALLIPAGIVAVAGWSDPGPSAIAWIGDLGATALLAALGGAALIVAILAFAFAWQLMRQNGRLLERLDALDGGAADGSVVPSLAPAQPQVVGKPAPFFVLPDLDGRPVGLADLLAEDRELLLFFSDPGCHACNPVLPAVGRRQREPGEGPLPVVMSLGDTEVNRVKAAEHGLGLVLLQEDFELARALGISGMPGAVLIGRDGRIAAEPAQGSDQVAALLAGLGPVAEAAPIPSLELTRVGGAA